MLMLVHTCQTPRGAILIFLLQQVSHTAESSKPGKVGLPNAFTSYIQFLPSSISIPTCWNSHERSVLVGTSLEAALEAKLNSLDREFSSLRDATTTISWCWQTWWDTESGSLSFDDWKLVDAFYRSRALDLPGTGHAMVPCIDFANHASGEAAVAFYGTDTDGNAVLVLRDGKTLKTGDEVTITYGDEKGACEMLFSYGFLEETMTSAKELYLDLDIPNDDPLKIAKMLVFKTAPGFRIFSQGDTIGWEGPFVWLLCVNEEDGLEFKVLQSNDGERELRVLWNDCEIADVSGLELLLQADPKWDIFKLRAAVILRDRIAQQLSILKASTVDPTKVSFVTQQSAQIWHLITKLRDLEEELMHQAYYVLDQRVRQVQVVHVNRDTSIH